ncbi:acyl carrier protein [Halothiobacillus sp.]|uniref:acyl carrier protein n=1 Tax=Halothiobacillus sp. TaxID=1891311 RepID=UPI002AD41572|nr:acyl carrier protein [Halothiobacillus sp.]
MTSVPSKIFLNVRETVIETLGLSMPPSVLDQDSPLLGEIPELDSMGVVLLLTALEARFGLTLSDDEIDSEWFRTLGTLTEAIEVRLPQAD